MSLLNAQNQSALNVADNGARIGAEIINIAGGVNDNPFK